MTSTDWYRPTGMGYAVYVPANDHTNCQHPAVLNCDSVIVSRSSNSWYWAVRRNARVVPGTQHDGFKTQAAAKAAVEKRFAR
jgi:hypothetical protein